MHAMLALSELRVYRPYTPRRPCQDPHSAVAAAVRSGGEGGGRGTVVTALGDGGSEGGGSLCRPGRFRLFQNELVWK